MNISRSPDHPSSPEPADTEVEGSRNSAVPTNKQANGPSRSAIARHDLRNALYSILLHLECMKYHVDSREPEAANESLDSIEHAVEQAEQLVDAILNGTR